MDMDMVHRLDRDVAVAVSRRGVGETGKSGIEMEMEIRADLAGPVMVLGVPPIRKSFGWRPAERIPTTFPRKLRLPGEGGDE